MTAQMISHVFMTEGQVVCKLLDPVVSLAS